MTSDLERSKKYLRSILLATKGGVPEAQLVKRYREQTGENIPFRRFNCSSLQAFLQSVPDVCRVTVRGGAVVVEGVATAETKHIKEMVKMQGLHPAARTRGNGSGGGGGGGRREMFPVQTSAVILHQSSPRPVQRRQVAASWPEILPLPGCRAIS